MAKRKRPDYYAVRVGRKPGGFDTYEAALAFVGDANPPDQIQQPGKPKDQVHERDCQLLEDTPEPDEIIVKVEKVSATMPPPSSQSYFDKFPDFQPDVTSSFDDEFDRFASSQGLKCGSKDFRRERTKAIRDELRYHYSSQLSDTPECAEDIPELTKEDLSKKETLAIYQNMCREIGVDQGSTIAECRRQLKSVLVNIIDYIDARRVPGKKIVIWDWKDFAKFSAYTLHGNKRIDVEEAKADGGFLSALLQRLIRPGPKMRRLPLTNGTNYRGITRKMSTEDDIRLSKRIRVSASRTHGVRIV
ncbi:hypothetical protein GGR52DRAFT_491732 [Hypoxylon sp. FL1284]|nr:hypothetical protein GGR52DRAFT_491732 [Hypoxylon sp. FL1284]